MSHPWEKLKPSKPEPTATAVDVSPDRQHVILTWADGVQTLISARALRQGCPCAACVDEFTNERLVEPEKIPRDLKLEKVSPVGNYALAFAFGDGHSTGIFDWGYLRRLSDPKAAGGAGD